MARSRGAVLDSEDLMFALSHLWVGSAKMVNETALPGREPRSDGEFARPEVRRRVHAREPGRADARGAGRGQRRAPALYAAAAQEPALPGARHRELLHGPASVQGGIRFQLHRRDASRAFRCISAAGTSSAAFPRRRRRRSGCRPSRCRRSWPCSWAFRDATCRATAIRPRRIPTATSRSSRRMTGASRRA